MKSNLLIRVLPAMLRNSLGCMSLVSSLTLVFATAQKANAVDAVRGPHWQAGEIIICFREGSDPQIAMDLSRSALPMEKMPAALRLLDASNRVSVVRPITHPKFRKLKDGSRLRRTYLFHFTDERLDVPIACQSLSKDKAIEYAEPNYLYQPDYVFDCFVFG